MNSWTPTAPRPAPANTVGFVGWARENLFATKFDTALTVLAITIILYVTKLVFGWAIIDASFSGTDRTACLKEVQGACWPFIEAKFGQFIYGRYPEAERWRVDLVFAAGLIGLVPMLMPTIGHKRANMIFLLGFYPVFAFIMLTGGVLGLAEVDTTDWGGLLVTLVVAVTGIVASLPLGILLALGRR
ncbi:MAG: amino acid ABC transporter permease, partial [Alphaproteobacteria bacterium]|nr:amino acid ABC transporter permease [Alphaproteobacteria bacterium]